LLGFTEYKMYQKGNNIHLYLYAFCLSIPGVGNVFDSWAIKNCFGPFGPHFLKTKNWISHFYMKHPLIELNNLLRGSDKRPRWATHTWSIKGWSDFFARVPNFKIFFNGGHKFLKIPDMFSSFFLYFVIQSNGCIKTTLGTQNLWPLLM